GLGGARFEAGRAAGAPLRVGGGLAGLGHGGRTGGGGQHEGGEGREGSRSMKSHGFVSGASVPAGTRTITTHEQGPRMLHGRRPVGRFARARPSAVRLRPFVAVGGTFGRNRRRFLDVTRP